LIYAGTCTWEDACQVKEVQGRNIFPMKILEMLTTAEAVRNLREQYLNSAENTAHYLTETKIITCHARLQKTIGRRFGQNHSWIDENVA